MSADEVWRDFRRRLERHLQGPNYIGERPVNAEAAAEQIEARLRAALRDRGVPPEWLEEMTFELERDGTDGDALVFQVHASFDVDDYLSRPPIRYHPGVPPV